MNSLFDNIQLQNKLTHYNFNCKKTPAILMRWYKLISSTAKNEEQLQADFLNDIFGEVLGYTYKRGE